MLRFIPLNSGSNGNSIYVENGSVAILIDAGLSRKRTLERISLSGGDVNKIKAIIITHEHTDHVSGLKILSKYHSVPVHMTKGTADVLNERGILPDTFVIIPSEGVFSVGNIRIRTGRTYHDAREPIYVRIESNNKIITYITDTGFVDYKMKNTMKYSDLIFLEANYDPETLARNEKYPFYLKERIKGRYGHLSNLDASYILRDVATERNKYLFLGHLSEQNNSPETVLRFVPDELKNKNIMIASRDSISDIVEL